MMITQLIINSFAFLLLKSSLSASSSKNIFEQNLNRAWKIFFSMPSSSDKQNVFKRFSKIIFIGRSSTFWQRGMVHILLFKFIFIMQAFNCIFNNSPCHSIGNTVRTNTNTLSFFFLPQTGLANFSKLF